MHPHFRILLAIVLILFGLAGTAFGFYALTEVIDWGQGSFFDGDCIFVMASAFPAFFGAWIAVTGIRLLKRPLGRTRPWDETFARAAAILTFGLVGTAAAFCGGGSLLAFALGHVHDIPDAPLPAEYARYGTEWLAVALVAFVLLWLVRPPHPRQAE